MLCLLFSPVEAASHLRTFLAAVAHCVRACVRVPRPARLVVLLPLLVLFYHGLLELAMSFLDPFGNEGSQFQNIQVRASHSHAISLVRNLTRA